MQGESSRLPIVLTLAAAMLAAAPAAHAFVSWSNPSGTGSFFSWSGGGSDNGLFGSPTLVNGTTFSFTPSAFAATGSGTGATATDRLEVRITATGAHNFTAIRITETGDYLINGSGSVQVGASTVLTDLANLRPPLLSALPTNPLFPISSGGGIWNAHIEIDLSAASPDWTDLMLIVTNTLSASSAAGASASVTKGSILIELIPTPGAGVVLLLAAGMAGRRRRI
jgi:hypothetical protein